VPVGEVQFQMRLGCTAQTQTSQLGLALALGLSNLRLVEAFSQLRLLDAAVVALVKICDPVQFVLQKKPVAQPRNEKQTSAKSHDYRNAVHRRFELTTTRNWHRKYNIL
jgi:hypothetical protein